MPPVTLSRGLAPRREVLDTGVVVLAQGNPTTPTVALNATFFTGTVCEPQDLPGTAFLTARLIDRGTGNRSGHDIAEMLDDRGVSLRAWVGRHTFTVSFVSLTEDFEDMLELVAEVVRQPSFPEAELEKRRVEAITSVRQDHDTTTARAAQRAVELLFGAGHPYSWPTKGTLASLERIRRADILDYHRTALVPSALRVAIVGDVDADAAVAASARVFEGWTGPPAPERPLPPRRETERAVGLERMPGKAQTDIVYGFIGVRRGDPRYHAYSMMNNVLGQFGLGGRLADNIRERQGMAYYAYSTLDATVGEGPLLIRAGVDPRNVERAIEAIDAEVRELGAHGPRPEELEDTRESLIGSIPRLLETNESIADFLQTAEQFGLGLDHDRRLPDLLRSVTLEQVADAARDVLDPSRAAVAIAGSHE